MNEYGEMIRKARIAQGIGLLELARKIGVSGTFISKLEKGEFKASTKTLLKIADALRMEEYKLLKKAGKMHPKIEEYVWENYYEIVGKVVTR